MKKTVVFTLIALSLLGLSTRPFLRGQGPSISDDTAHEKSAGSAGVLRVDHIALQVRTFRQIDPQLTADQKSQSDLQTSPNITRFRMESSRLGHLTQDAKLDEARLNLLARKLTAPDAKELAQTALDVHAGHSERFLATFLLAKRSQDFHAELALIAKSESPLFQAQTEPHTIEEMDKAFEVSVRVQALIGLDRANSSGAIAAQQLSEIFSDVQRSSHHVLIAKLASLGRDGAIKHDSLIEKYIDEKLEGALHAESRD